MHSATDFVIIHIFHIPYLGKYKFTYCYRVYIFTKITTVLKIQFLYFNLFTAVDAILCPGVITHPEINLLICYNIYYVCCHPVCKGHACMGLVSKITGSFYELLHTCYITFQM